MDIFRMSAISSPIQQPQGSIAVTDPANVAPELSPNELSGYRISTYRENEVRKGLLLAYINARAKVSASQDIRIPLIRNMYMRSSQSPPRCSGIKEAGKSPCRNHCLRYLRFRFIFSIHRMLAIILSGPNVNRSDGQNVERACPCGAFG